ncbi:protoporphyrinogen/coproporphyrinogen oxidase [Confluentibacter citreus]|uniref:protoporphyrinogen/coproporphyrinogen oxidase n=1 Tax=Confluentibacter citreus TaxID=2007307 RepID=UPI000C28E90C|nr:FAD-dependent oxidoreductase [Confluentibacter citreus]
MGNIILGGGIAGVGAAYELKKHNIGSIILEKNDSWGGLLDNFIVDGFRFDKFIHLSFSNDKYVNNIFFETPLIKHKPLSSNYYKGTWLKHPAQNNLYPLNKEEQDKILQDFRQRKDLDASKIKNYEEWLRVQYGDYFAENFPIPYTEKYWTLKASELETKWVGERMYKPTLEEIEKGCQTDLTPNTYYAKEMRYPKKGGYKSFLEPMIKGLDIRTNSKVCNINFLKNEITLKNGEILVFDNLISSLPLPEICKLINDIPEKVLKASQKLNFTSGYLVSLGFNKPDIGNKLWFYIYDKDILPARVYSPSLKSKDNAPEGCSSLQAEIYFNRGEKLKMNDLEILDQTIQRFIKMGLFKEEDLIVKDIRCEKYANIIFDHHIYENRKIVLDYLKENKIISVGRFGEWDYFWSDQSLISGRNGALQLIKLSKSNDSYY